MSRNPEHLQSYSLLSVLAFTKASTSVSFSFLQQSVSHLLGFHLSAIKLPSFRCNLGVDRSHMRRKLSLAHKKPETFFHDPIPQAQFLSPDYPGTGDGRIWSI